ncbi:MAG TPA: glycoside hydrolase family 95 protein, partial [Chitinophagaceae bacterium]|nr:glycoside hydrolase family 95 protein [Chitinophagaceae bacterium]
MKPLFALTILMLCTIALQAQEMQSDAPFDPKSINPATMIWLSKPAAKWEEALPVGNGRLGAMIYGGVNEAIIQLNEDTYWSGGPYSTVHKGGHEKLKEIQQLVFDQKMLAAHNLFGRHLMGYPVEQQKYQSLGNLNLQFDHGKDFSNYKRWLDLETGVSGVEYTVDGKQFRQEILSSHPDQVIAIRITCNTPGSITFTANLRGVRNQAHSNYGTDYFEMNGEAPDVLKLTGKSADYLGVEGKLRYEAKARFVPEGGTMKQDGYILKVSNANAVTIYIVAATNFRNYKDVSGNQQERVKHYMGLTAQKDFSAVRQAHIKDHQHLFSRVTLNLPNSANSFLPTDERMTQIQTTPDPSLAALCYQFGRYLLIGS